MEKDGVAIGLVIQKCLEDGKVEKEERESVKK